MKRLGEDAVKELMPAEDLPLLAAILKAERKKGSVKVSKACEDVSGRKRRGRRRYRCRESGGFTRVTNRSIC